MPDDADAQITPIHDPEISSRPEPLVTLFATPKPMGSATDLIQRNSLGSWAKLAPEVEVLLLGDEPGIAELATELGVRHAPGLRYNTQGTPLVSSAFDLARQQSSTPLLAYCNSDVILLSDFVATLKRLAEQRQFSEWVAFGRRTDLKVDEAIDFDAPDYEQRLVQQTREQGRICAQVCKEYFVYPRSLYQNVPDFAVGRGNWDNWMIQHAKEAGVPVINTSSCLTAIHQVHDYRHVDAFRFQVYVSGDEARTNQKLAGGRHVVSGSVATWRMNSEGIRREPSLLLNPEFWADVPRFLRFLANMMINR